MREGHEAWLRAVEQDHFGVDLPWRVHPGLGPVELCVVTGPSRRRPRPVAALTPDPAIDFVPGIPSYCSLELTQQGGDALRWRILFYDKAGSSDFVVLASRYLCCALRQRLARALTARAPRASVARTYVVGEPVDALYGSAGDWYPGVILDARTDSDSPWERYNVG
jgi:hypothetical protein